MTEPVQIAVIVSIAPTIAALAALLVSWKNRKRLEDNTAKLRSIMAKLNKLHIDVNDDRLSQLLAATGAKEHAAGVVDGRHMSVVEEQARSKRGYQKANESKTGPT